MKLKAFSGFGWFWNDTLNVFLTESAWKIRFQEIAAIYRRSIDTYLASFDDILDTPSYMVSKLLALKVT